MSRDDRYIRQKPFEEIGDTGQKKLAAAQVCIIGAGAVGTRVAEELARAGVGHIRIADREVVSLYHLQKHALFTQQDAADELPKAEAAVRHLREINDEIESEAVVTDVNASNIEKLTGDADLIIDGVDNYQTRFLINEICFKNRIPWIYASIIGARSSVMRFLWGDETPCLRCLMPEVPVTGLYDTSATAGTIGPAAGVAAAYISASALRMLLGENVTKDFFFFSMWDDFIQKAPIKKDPECPVCGKHHYEMLEQKASGYSSSVCGHNSWQVIPLRPESSTELKMDLEGLGERLKRIGMVKVTPFYLRFEDDTVSFKVFPDGRAMIDKVSDEQTAKMVYSEYIG